MFYRLVHRTEHSSNDGVLIQVRPARRTKLRLKKRNMKG